MREGLKRDGLGNLVSASTGEIVNVGGALRAQAGSQEAIDEVLSALDTEDRRHGYKVILPAEVGQSGTYNVDMYTGGKVYVRKSGKPSLSWWIDIFWGTPYERQGGVALRYRQAEQARLSAETRNTRHTRVSASMRRSKRKSRFSARSSAPTGNSSMTAMVKGVSLALDDVEKEPLREGAHTADVEDQSADEST